MAVKGKAAAGGAPWWDQPTSYQSLVDSVDDVGILMLDLDGTIRTSNPGMQSLTGRSGKDLVGSDFASLFPSDLQDIGYPAQALGQVVSAKRFEGVARQAHKDGSEFWANIALAVIVGDGRAVLGISMVVRDVTAQRRADEAARKAGAYSRSLIEASLDPLVTIAPDGTITDVNGATERVTGLGRDVLVGTDFSDYFTSPSEARTGYERVFRDGQVVDYPLELRHADGSVTPVLYNAAVYRDETGEVIGVFAAARDVTEQRLAERRIRQQSQEILELSTPVMQIWEGVVAVPLIGNLDSQRTQLFMERLLERIVETNSPLAIVDIMGVPTIDTQTAQHLMETITAVRLLGAQVILTGVRPAIAQTLVHLGVDWSSITTRSSLSAGLKVALESLELRVVDRETGAPRS
jgi:PAS domain S-box-containing protein